MQFLISAAHKSSGKTTLSLGLAAAFRERGLRVQTFKKGPDYIDPIWLQQASGRPCYNLDPYLTPWPELATRYKSALHNADLALVEGNKGLFDGLALDGSNSNAALARHLGLPVILVLDARGMTRGIAPLILGYQAFDPTIRIVGVILNQLGGSRHESKLRQVIEHYTKVPVLGALHHRSDFTIEERHLGLIPGNEITHAETLLSTLRQAVNEGVDLDALLTVVQQAAPEPSTSVRPELVEERRSIAAPSPLRIAIAQDRAFGFYYADDLEALQAAGATLHPFDTLQDSQLPEADALFMGGGFPESFAPELSANTALRNKIRSALSAGMPAYAECGGLMYLARSLKVGDSVYPMCGVIPGDVEMRPRPVGRGYVHLRPTADFPWPNPPTAGLRAHEFHYSDLTGLPDTLTYAWDVERGHGLDGQRDGLVIGHLLAAYTHLRNTGTCTWAQQFVAFARACRAS